MQVKTALDRERKCAEFRHETGSQFVTQRPSDPGIQRQLETQLTRWPCSIMNYKCRLICRGVQIELFTARVLCWVSYRVLDKVSKWVRVFISGAMDWHPVISGQQQTPDNDFISAFQTYFLHFGHFFENRKNSGLTTGQNDDRVTRWPNDPVPCLAPIQLARCRFPGLAVSNAKI